jgi:hypothetical protein
MCEKFQIINSVYLNYTRPEQEILLIDEEDDDK